MKLDSTVYTVHLAYLADIKFGKLVCDVNWRVFSIGTRAIQITYGYKRVWTFHTFNLADEDKFAKPSPN